MFLLKEFDKWLLEQEYLWILKEYDLFSKQQVLGVRPENYPWFLKPGYAWTLEANHLWLVKQYELCVLRQNDIWPRSRRCSKKTSIIWASVVRHLEIIWGHFLVIHGLFEDHIGIIRRSFGNHLGIVFDEI